MSQTVALRKALTWALESGQYVVRRRGGPGSRRYECRLSTCRARGPSPESLKHSPKCEYARSLALLQEDDKHLD